MKTVVSVTSNGIGMGHICRQLGVVLSGEKQFDSVILSLSGALPRILQTTQNGDFPEAAERGVRFEYSPSRKTGWHQRAGWRGAAWRKYPGFRWEHYLADRIVALVEETAATDVIFDGVAAYDGVVEAMGRLRQLGGVRTNWYRPCLWQDKVPVARLEREAAFDRIIEPGDYAAAFDQGPTVGRPGVIKVAPVSMTEVLRLNDRVAARHALGLPVDGKVLLLAPGAGAVGSVDEIGAAVIAQIQKLGPEWTIAVTKQAIAQHSFATTGGQVVVLEDVFPLARQLAAFDAAISASGYNAANELVCAKIPTLFIPSLNHETDDQPARAHGLARLGAALDVMDSDLTKAFEQLLDPIEQARLVAGCELLPPATGGLETANLLAMDQEPSTTGGNSVVGEWKKRPAQAPGRPIVDLRAPIRQRGVGFELQESITVAELQGDTPIEHVVAGSSQEYLERRKQIAHWLYR